MKKEKSKKPEYVDDGHTVYNMDIDGFRWHDRKKAKNNYVDKDEKKELVKAAYKAYLPMLLLILAAFIVTALLLYLWLK